MNPHVTERIVEMLKGGFNISSIAKATGWTETQIIHMRAQMMDKEPKAPGRTREQNLTKADFAAKLREKTKKPLVGIEKATKALLIGLLTLVTEK